MNTLLEPWMDKRDLAGHLRCSTRSIERLMHEGLPHATILGRVKFRASEVEAWLHATRRLEWGGDRLAIPNREEARHAA